ncbi:aminotransferase class V-fold PLP-dependent enzyme [Patulibacter defluvii]|uniref:aminotransferase class V-fold PLP-dependent enzyme n=1 Tax=Patulibacter defluvii TaxID=3095358 RepID=UPI002A763A44|nr:aminotransferase class V-fold PLP-dependent enzyme [Patulibacter sp. DM4]
MDPAQLRAEFPVLRDVAYLNAGSCGPLPRAASAAAAGVVHQAEQHGRTADHFVATRHTQDARRQRYAALVGAEPEDVALTTAASEGIVRVLLGLEWHAGDEIVTAEEEHPGLLGPLAALARRHELLIRSVPLERIVEAVDERTRLVACSHVRWTDGTPAPAGLAALRGEVPVLLDGAQGAGAIATDVTALGCAFYAAAGQKWLCGPIGSGFLWIDPAWQPRLRAVGPTYLNLAEPAAGLDARPWPDARAHDATALSGEASAAALAAFDVLDEHGWPELHARAATLADRLAVALAERGRTVAPRGATTLVAWSEPDPAATVARLAAAGVVVRDLPGSDRVRASVGGWNDERDLDRLLSAL